MALFVDGPACSIDDLIDQDSGLLDVARTAGINVSTKLRLATEEIRSDVRLWLNRQRPPIEVLWAPGLRIEQVVITAPLKRWEGMHALALIYRDAYFSQLVDRYQPKWQEFANLAREAREGFIADGIGLANDPVPQALPPALSATPGTHAGGVFYASVSLVNGARQEGAASHAASITIPDGHLMAVAAVGTPANAVGFNVYAGTSPEAMFLQNDILLPVTATYLYIPGQRSGGPLPGSGQAPDYSRKLARTCLRG